MLTNDDTNVYLEPGKGNTKRWHNSTIGEVLPMLSMQLLHIHAFRLPSTSTGPSLADIRFRVWAAIRPSPPLLLHPHYHLYRTVNLPRLRIA
jgi:hypothetical protein